MISIKLLKLGFQFEGTALAPDPTGEAHVHVLAVRSHFARRRATFDGEPTTTSYTTPIGVSHCFLVTFLHSCAVSRQPCLRIPGS